MTIQEAQEMMGWAIPIGRMAEFRQVVEVPRTVDRPADVARCLNCPIPAGKCAGVCSSGAVPKAVRHRSKASEKTSQIAQLTQGGWRAVEIAQALGLSQAVVGYHKRKAREIGLL